jgi:hypothetical protein
MCTDAQRCNVARVAQNVRQPKATTSGCAAGVVGRQAGTISQPGVPPAPTQLHLCNSCLQLLQVLLLFAGAVAATGSIGSRPAFVLQLGSKLGSSHCARAAMSVSLLQANCTCSSAQRCRVHADEALKAVVRNPSSEGSQAGGRGFKSNYPVAPCCCCKAEEALASTHVYQHATPQLPW